ncbi:MAG: hypothetical protein KF870_01785 [Leadbetterella sp.]|nr:hypothetical protein [Leadbetterella sp.]
METTSQNNSGALRIGLIVLLAALALVGYLYFNAQTKNKDLQGMLDTKVGELSDTRVKLDSISRALDAKILEVESLGGSVTELEKIKAELEKDIASLKSSTNFSTKKYNDKIAEYEKFLVAKDEEIMKLKEENGMLSSENLTLKTEKEEVVNQNVALSQSKDSLTNVVEEVSTKNKDLQAKVNTAAALKAVNVEVVGLTSKGKEKDGKIKSKKVDQLKVTYNLPSNALTEKTSKDVYLRILDPNGAVLNDMGRGGVLDFGGKEIGYTLRQAVPYTNNDQQVAMYYQKGQEFNSGVYAVELYSEGFKIGTGNFQIK